MPNSFYHKEITNEQWNRIKCLFPEAKKVGRPPLNSRTVFKAVLWIMKSGARWRDLPARYGNWNSIFHKFRQWCDCGLFKSLLQLLNTDPARASECLLLNKRTSVDIGGKTVLADRAYSCDKIRDYLEECGARVCIPDKSNFKTKHSFDATLYKYQELSPYRYSI